jgi:hypothetical protein
MVAVVAAIAEVAAQEVRAAKRQAAVQVATEARASPRRIPLVLPPGLGEQEAEQLLLHVAAEIHAAVAPFVVADNALAEVLHVRDVFEGPGAVEEADAWLSARDGAAHAHLHSSRGQDRSAIGAEPEGGEPAAVAAQPPCGVKKPVTVTVLPAAFVYVQVTNELSSKPWIPRTSLKISAPVGDVNVRLL